MSEQNGSSNGNMPRGVDVPPEETEDVPEVLVTRTGRYVSFAGLVERILEQFRSEFGEPAQLLDAEQDAVEQRQLLRDVAQYVTGVESVSLDQPDFARVLRTAYSELFGFGPLDALFADEAITTISIRGPKRISVRRLSGHDLVPVDTQFDDRGHLERTVQKLVRVAGRGGQEDQSFVEAGFVLNGRPVKFSLSAAPVTIDLSLDIRLHPAQSLTLEDLMASGMCDEKTADLLRGIVESGNGVVICGESETGKTTLVNALMAQSDLPRVVIQRAPELYMSDEDRAYDLDGDLPDFARLGSALLVLDEIRADNTAIIASLAGDVDEAGQLLMAFRGSSNSDRTRVALGMLARRAHPEAPEASVHALFERIPFMILTGRRNGKLRVVEIVEVVPQDETYSAHSIMKYRDGQWCMTGIQPVRTLPLDASFFEENC